MVKVAIISFEHMHAWSYAAALMQLPQVEFAAFADDDPKRLAQAKKMYPHVKAYASKAGWKKLLEENICDAVIVTSANVRHREQVIAAAHSCKNVLCEKPLSTTLKDARSMIEECHKTGIKLMTAFPMRYSPAVLRARSIIQDGTLGKILAVKTSNHGSMPGGWFTDKKLSGGGAITDHTVHIADLLRYILGQEVTEVYAEMSTKLHAISVEDCALLMLKLSGGAFASIDASWSRHPAYKIWGDVMMDFKGTRANLSIDCFPRLVHLYQNKTMKHSTFSGGDNLDLCLVADFADCIIHDRTPSITGKDGLRAMEVSIAAYKAIKDKCPVALPIK